MLQLRENIYIRADGVVFVKEKKGHIAFST
jgi:hypothetical protein